MILCHFQISIKNIAQHAFLSSNATNTHRFNLRGHAIVWIYEYFLEISSVVLKSFFSRFFLHESMVLLTFAKKKSVSFNVLQDARFLPFPATFNHNLQSGIYKRINLPLYLIWSANETITLIKSLLQWRLVTIFLRLFLVKFLYVDTWATTKKRKKGEYVRHVR